MTTLAANLALHHIRAAERANVAPMEMNVFLRFSAGAALARLRAAEHARARGESGAAHLAEARSWVAQYWYLRGKV